MPKLLDRIGTITAPYPNWARPVTEVFAYSTSIFTSRDGSEQRSSARVWPRMEVSFQTDQTRELADRISADLNRWPTDGLWVLPARWRWTLMDGAISSGATSFDFVGDLPWWLVEGAKLVLESGSAQEVVSVGSVAGNTISLSAAVAQGYADGARVMLGLDVRYSDEASLRAVVAPHKGGQIEFLVDPGSTPDWSIPGADISHEGYEIFPFRPNWREPIDLTINDQRETVDFDRGVIDVSRFRGFSIMQESMTFTGLSQEAVDELVLFFMRMRGMRGHFWIASYLDDVRPVYDVIEGGDTLTLPGTDILDAYNGDATFTTVAARWPDGCVQFNRIDGMADASGDTLVQFRSEWGRGIDGATQLSWGLFARFASDRLEIDWQASEAADIKLPFRALDNLWIDGVRVGGGLWEQPVAEWFNWTAPFDEARPYSQFGLEAIGVPLSYVDRELASIAGYYSGTIENTGSLNWTARLGAFFFDENDDEITVLPPGEVAKIELSDSRPPDETQDFEVTLDCLIPAGTRTIRLRHGNSHSLVDGSDGNQCWIVTKHWGLLYDEAEDVQCPT